MRKISKLILILIFSNFCVLSQQDEKKELPKLDIPEITIVGKKAVTLPFAKKGEYTNIEYILPSNPDTSFIADKINLLPVSIPSRKYHRFIDKISGFFEGSFGSFSLLDFYGLLRHSDLFWDASIRAGFSSTSGHVKNSDGNRFEIGGDYGTLIFTDNDYIKNFRLQTSLDFFSDKYGIYGITDSSVTRNRHMFNLNLQATTTEFKPIAFSLGLGLSSLNLKDNSSEISVFAPIFKIASSFNLFKLNFQSKFAFETSSLDYRRQVESPSAIQFSLITQNFLSQNIFTSIGLKYFYTTSSEGEFSKFIYPIAIMKILLTKDIKFSLWFEPDASNNSYISNILENPFLYREMKLRNAVSPVNFGTTFEYSQKFFSIETKISYSNVEDIMYPAVKNGIIQSEYADVERLKLDLNSTFQIYHNFNLYLNGIFNNTIDKNTRKQLVMLPDFKLQTKWELSLQFPLKLFLEFDYTGKRSVDEIKTLKPYYLLGIGSRWNVIKNAVLGIDVENIFNTKLDYFYGYEAPGVTFKTKFQYNF